MIDCPLCEGVNVLYVGTLIVRCTNCDEDVELKNKEDDWND